MVGGEDKKKKNEVVSVQDSALLNNESGPVG